MIAIYARQSVDKKIAYLLRVRLIFVKENLMKQIVKLSIFSEKFG